MKIISNKILSLIFAALLTCVCANIKAQGYEIRVDTIFTPSTRVLRIVTVRTVPKFVLDFNASYNLGAMELTAHNGGFSATDFSNGKSYCARNGFGLNLTGKLPLSKKGNFWLDITAGYSKFASDLVVKNDEQGKVHYNVINGGFGAEYNFTPYHKLNYYTGLNILFSSVSGKAEGLQIQENTTVDITHIDVTINPSFRIGYNIFVGMGYAFDKNVGINFGLRFTHINLLLKKSEAPTSGNMITGLNDESTPDPPNHLTYSGWKQFAYSSAYLGISYFFGVKENKYKMP